MIESPVLHEIVAETKAESLIMVLRARFEVVPTDVTGALRLLRDLGELDRLLVAAVRCHDFEAFRGCMRP